VPGLAQTARCGLEEPAPGRSLVLLPSVPTRGAPRRKAPKVVSGRPVLAMGNLHRCAQHAAHPPEIPVLMILFTNSRLGAHSSVTELDASTVALVRSRQCRVTGFDAPTMFSSDVCRCGVNLCRARRVTGFPVPEVRPRCGLGRPLSARSDDLVSAGVPISRLTASTMLWVSPTVGSEDLPRMTFARDVGSVSQTDFASAFDSTQIQPHDATTATSDEDRPECILAKAQREPDICGNRVLTLGSAEAATSISSEPECG